MEDFQHVGYSKEVIEFVAVAKEFCDFVETAPQMQRRDFIQRLQKFIPLIYLKGSLLPESDSGDSGLKISSPKTIIIIYMDSFINCWENTMNTWKFSMIICSLVKFLSYIR